MADISPRVDLTVHYGSCISFHVMQLFTYGAIFFMLMWPGCCKSRLPAFPLPLVTEQSLGVYPVIAVSGTLQDRSGSGTLPQGL